MGVAIERNAYLQVHDDLENLKRKHFKYDPDIPVILHRKEIIHKQGPFYVLQNPEKEKAFNNDLTNFLNNMDCIIILIVVDKKSLIEKHGKSAFHPYHFALTAMLERYCGYLNFWNNTGDVVAEQRGGKEDTKLKIEYRYVFENGTYYYPSSSFQKALTTKEIKIGTKKANISGLQIADLLAHPCKQEFLFEKSKITRPTNMFGQIICNCVKNKYNIQIYSKKCKGYGKVFLG